MKKVLKEFLFTLCDFSGVTYYFKRRNRDKITILMYHGVVKKPLVPFCWTQINEREMEYQLTYLKKHYSILKLSEVMDRIQNSLPLPHNTAVVTFDDGYKNNFTIAYPLLKRLEIPATIFLATGSISTKALNWYDQLYLGIKNSDEKEIDLRQYGLGLNSLASDKKKQHSFENIVEHLKRVPSNLKEAILKDILHTLGTYKNMSETDFVPLDWKEIIKMDQEGLVEFGGHSVTHNILSRLSDAEMENEIVQSCKAIENHLGAKCMSFAYPNGTRNDFTQRSKDLLRMNGIQCGLTTISGLNTVNEDRYELKRIGVGADTSKARFKLLTSGALDHFKKAGIMGTVNIHAPQPESVRMQSEERKH